MWKTYLLGIPLFNLTFLFVYFVETTIYCIQNIENTNAAPVTLSSLIYMLLVYGGFILVSMIYGRYLFSKWKGTKKKIICFSVLTFLITALLSVLQIHSSFWIKALYWLLPSCEQTLGFLIGSFISYSRNI